MADEEPSSLSHRGAVSNSPVCIVVRQPVLLYGRADVFTYWGMLSAVAWVPSGISTIFAVRWPPFVVVLLLRSPPFVVVLLLRSPPFVISHRLHCCCDTASAHIIAADAVKMLTTASPLRRRSECVERTLGTRWGTGTDNIGHRFWVRCHGSEWA